jgi:hypothetical protein
MITDPVGAARDRAIVVLDDGRLATLCYWPGADRNRRRRAGRQAHVRLANGAFMSIDPERIVERWM